MVQKKSTRGLLPVCVWTALVAILIIAAPARSTTADKSNTDFWQSQYSDFSERIANYRGGLGKTVALDDQKAFDRNALIWDTDRDPTDVVLRRTEAMLADFSKNTSKTDLNAFAARLAALKKTQSTQHKALAKTTAAAAVNETYLAAQVLNREIMLASPALDFTDLIFIERGIRGPGNEIDGDHMCDQYYGHNGRLGGGMFILKNFATSPQKVDIMSGLTVPSGTNKGKSMTSGTFLSPDLSYDGNTIIFAWSSGGSDKFKPENRFNIFSVNIDGTDLKRITDGDYDDIHPCWLPNGRIVFISTRRTGYGRCHGRNVPSYTLYSMKPDGSDIICLSYHETNEWHPSVANDGRLIFSRWDYVDRDFSAAHHLWYCNPDGTNPRSWGGNYSFPLNSLGAGPFADERSARPWAEFNGRSIPGSSKVIATAGPHHGQALGSLVLIDYNIPDNNKMSQITRLTPDAAFPEGSTAWRSGYVYGTAWPLSESSYLCNYNNSIIILDKSGSKQSLYETTSDKDLRPIYPIPLRARTKPASIAVQTYQGERWSPQVPKATLNVINVNNTDEYGKLPSGVAIKSLRIIEVIPKCTPNANEPRINYGNESLARMAIGTAPVESDGSVYCDVPVGKPLYFQLLDDKGMAVQSMRSVTYVHPGEQLSCVGCHEDKWTATPVMPVTIASKRTPSKITPEAGGVEPINFYRLVKPLFDQKCQPCHVQNNKGPKDMSYSSLEPYSFYFTGGGDCNVPYHGGSRTTPGQFGSYYARMGKAMLSDTHKKAREDGKFTSEDMRRVTLWLDCNSVELGAYHDVDLQRKGQLVWPRLDVDPQDPQSLNYEAQAMEEKNLWVKLDDTDPTIEYSTGWDPIANQYVPGYKGTEHKSSTTGATSMFTFTGVGVRYYGYKRNDLGIAKISVDGTEKARVDCYSKDNPYDGENQLLYQITGLSNGQHTIQIEMTGIKNGNSTSGNVIVDAFSYCKLDPTTTRISKQMVIPKFSIMVRALGRPIVLPSTFSGKQFTINILNLSGRLVQRIEVKANSVVTSVSPGIIGKGIYIVNCRMPGKSVSQKIVKMR